MNHQNREIYTSEQWEKDGTFKAQPGQEIEAEMYNNMLDIVPPLSLPAAAAETALRTYRIPVHAGFLMGEAADMTEAGTVYRAFGMNDYGKGKRYFYLGLFPEARKLNGIFYVMDPPGALPGDGLFPESYFENDRAAIRAAADYEASLFKYEFKNGRKISSTTLYVPMFG